MLQQSEKSGCVIQPSFPRRASRDSLFVATKASREDLHRSARGDRRREQRLELRFLFSRSDSFGECAVEAARMKEAVRRAREGSLRRSPFLREAIPLLRRSP